MSDGAGAIATEVANRAQAFGMKVIAYDPFLATHPLAELKTLEEMLAQADYISIHTPLTDQTRGMFKQAAFGRMKEGVVIINTARAKVLVEADLAEALKSGKVRAYGTDVWYTDPPVRQSPLLAAPNVFMTPHIGGSSKENLLRIGDRVVAILSRFKCYQGVLSADPIPAAKSLEFTWVAVTVDQAIQALNQQGYVRRFGRSQPCSQNGSAR